MSIAQTQRSRPPYADASAPIHAVADARSLQLRSSLRGMDLAAQEQALAPEPRAQASGYAAQSASLAPVQRSGPGAAPANPLATAAAGVRNASAPLPHLGAIQASFGRHDVGHVQAQVGGAAADAGHALGASAYATGDRVGFGAAPSLHTAAHEAAHVVQQRAGVSLLGGVGRSGDVYERHADQVADLVVQGKSAEGLLDAYAGGGSGGGGGAAVQREDACGPLADAFVPCEAEDPFAMTFPEPAAQRTEMHYKWVENGKAVSVPEQDYEGACTQRLRALERDGVAKMVAKASEARTLYDHFVEINADQRVVSWFSEVLGGVDMPSVGLITDAEFVAANAAKAASDKGSKALQDTIEMVRDGEKVINRAVNVMREYREGVISGAGLCETGLKVTAAVSFSIAGACATALLAPVIVAAATTAGMTTAAAATTGTMVAGGIAAGGTAGVANVAKQGSEMAHGLREDFDYADLVKAIAREGMLAAAAGPVAGVVAGRVAGPLAANLSTVLSRTVTAEAVEVILRGSFARSFRGVMSDTMAAIDDPDSMSMERFLGNLATNLLAGAIGRDLVSRIG